MHRHIEWTGVGPVCLNTHGVSLAVHNGVEKSSDVVDVGLKIRQKGKVCLI